jgi:hypothetical protein
MESHSSALWAAIWRGGITDAVFYLMSRCAEPTTRLRHTRRPHQ